ncbi:hypothetical protein G6F42_014624 [Rhizopus arrhizus]|nr:hypothetical protein G6F42_014624 [Rhizopus arrhizus]
MLESKVPLCYFLYHLLDEFSSENLFFFLEVEQFENYKKKTSRKYKEMARRIYDTYILNDSYLEINLDDRVKRDIADQMNADNGEICPSIFADAQTSAYIMLESSFIRFLHTSVYKDMVENCGYLNIHYGQEVTNTALNYLTQYLRHQQNIVIMHRIYLTLITLIHGRLRHQYLQVLRCLQRNRHIRHQKNSQSEGCLRKEEKVKDEFQREYLNKFNN